ncbi:ASCH domain-containing protein [Escherichia albertii]|uniref:hypothetical protein n=1 Tax=Escherichia albertii TaxID=208962 RepID=UPI0018479EFD|nr:hypothetical protein [Escherichia albertii]MCI5275825.1 hypothetical protein [Escherichia albertii]MCZ8661470.1 hypothetical protein [Escherichia albertii]MCZ9009722.1 hypothetical protein [Escherichia albertii]HCZ5333271.1 hypothetical protein [Escherichia albertii]
MKERGMIFNSEMVRAILDGRKTQTRRIIKNQREGVCWGVKPAQNPRCAGHTHDWWLPTGTQPYAALPACPHGSIGDRIWVRETWATLGNEDGCCVDWNDNLCKGDKKSAARIYRASCEQKPGDYGLWSIPDDADWKPHTENEEFEGAWRPSIHMPRWASRILLEITDVRVERLNDISECDAKAEGAPTECTLIGDKHYPGFRSLWKSIYGNDSWQASPWVWVIEFKRIQEAAQ